VEEAFSLMDLLNNLRAEFDGSPERIEKRDYPVEALREALFNAIVHRDYTVGASISINVFDNRCEIISPGGLPEGATEMAVLAGVSVPRNPNLAALFYRLKWIEAYGTGLSKIRAAYHDTGLEPSVDFLDGAVRVTLPNTNTNEARRIRETLRAKRDEHVPVQSNIEYGTVSLTADQKRVLSSLSESEPRTKAEVARLTGFSSTKTARLLKELVAGRFAAAVGNTKARTYLRLAQRATGEQHLLR